MNPVCVRGCNATIPPKKKYTQEISQHMFSCFKMEIQSNLSFFERPLLIRPDSLTPFSHTFK